MQKLPETKGWKWDALMMALMKNATIKGIAEVLRGKISETTEEKSENISPFISFKEPEKDCEKAKILFHAGTGTLSSYKDLLPYLAKSSRESELLGGFNFGSFEEYLNRDVDSLIIDGHPELHMTVSIGGVYGTGTAKGLFKAALLGQPCSKSRV